MNGEPTPPCPECRAGKHANCPNIAFDGDDQQVACPCAERGHGG